MTQDIKLTLLHSNDMHGDFLSERVDDKLVGGVARLSGYLNKVRAQEDNVLYAIAGDMFKGSIIDAEFLGLSTIELMNMLSPDVAAVGNHEIDYGVAHLLFLEKCARFPIVNANLFVRTNHSRLFTPYQILSVGGLKVMVIGVITEEVIAQTKNEGLIGSFIDVAEAAREIAVILDTYKTTDVDFTVLLTHIGFEKDCELASRIQPDWGVDLIIGGHTHTLLEAPHIQNGIPIVQVGSGTDQLGRFDLVFDGETHTLKQMDWQLVFIDDAHCPEDAALLELLHHYKSQTDAKYSRIVTRFPRALTHPERTQETELGNLFADVLQADSSFDIILYGSGSIRKEVMGPIVTYQELRESSPYDEELYMLEVTGAQFRRMMAYVLREEAFSGHTEFYQLSRGLRIVYSRSRKQFDEFRFNGEEIADDQLLKLALQRYHFNNFQRFFNVPLEEVAQNKKPRMIASSIFGILEELFSAAPVLDAAVEGRLVVLD